jgi:hypothetical protein
LENNNVVYSNINKFRNVWWFEPLNQKFEKEFYVTLNNEIERKLFLFYIPANSIPNPKEVFYQRKDKENKAKIVINISDDIFIDEKTKFDFTKYLIEKIFY